MSVSSAVTLLTDNWNASNTNSVTPQIDDITNQKRISGDNVLVYESSNVLKANALGTSSRERRVVLTIAIYTYTSRTQLNLLKSEVERIFDANQTDPFSDGAYDINEIIDEMPHSKDKRGLWRYDIKVELVNYNESR